MATQTESTECPVCASMNTSTRWYKGEKRVCNDCGMIYSTGSLGTMIVGPAPEMYPLDK